MAKRIFSLVIVIICAAALPVFAQDDDPILQAVNYLTTMQGDDGGFSTGWTPDSDPTTTADAVVALAAAEQSRDAIDAALAYLETQVNEGSVVSAGQIAKVITAVVAAGGDPAAFGEHNLIDDLLALHSEEAVFGFGPFDHCLAMAALQNAAVDLPEGTVEASIAAQSEEGGWGFMAGEAPDTNTTGLCIQALALTDESEAVAAGLAYLASIQNQDSGWPYRSPSDFGTGSDTNSTALVLQALIAAGENLANWHNPSDWLLSMQNESGAFAYQVVMPDDNIVATIAAIPALSGITVNGWAAESTD